MKSRSLLTTALSATLARAGLSAALLLSCSEPGDEGGVMVVVTTDMAVPLDIDTLLWSVTLDGETKPFKSDSFVLTSYEVLPVTLSIAAGRGTTGPVTIRLAGLQGGQERVTREARLRVPADGMKELSLALDFLCTKASLPSSCPAGETCSSGECVSSTIDEPATLDDYRATSATECFNTAECFESYEAELSPSRDGERCFLTGSEARLAPNVHLAMVVNTAAVGAHGACGVASSQECLVPLPQGGAGGWEASYEGSEGVEIRLPLALCRASATDRVLVSRLAGCPALKAGTPLCAVPPVCVKPDGIICPRGWGHGWVGIACRSSPHEWDTPLGRCYYPDRASAPGLACCENESHELAEPEDPLLIDDMSRGPAIKIKLDVPPDYVPGSWWTSVESGPSSVIEPAIDRFDYRDVVPPFTSPDGKTTIESAACLGSPGGFSANLVMMGFDWLAKLGVKGPAAFIDVSSYSGISFWAIATPPFAGFSGFSKDIKVLFPNVHTQSYAASATCNEEQGVTCDDFHTSLAVTDVWTKYYVNWNDLKQKDFEKLDAPFDKHLYQTIFASEGPGPQGTSQPFGFCISQIYFTKDESSKERQP